MDSEFGNALVLKDSGFVIRTKYPWLGCSPDAIVIENGESVLMECKSLKLGKTNEGLQFLRKCKCLTERSPGEFLLKKTNSYYTQIQFGLYICNLTRAKLLLYNDKSKKNIYIDVERDMDHIQELVRSLILLALFRTFIHE